jgi:hypothetical protein
VGTLENLFALLGHMEFTTLLVLRYLSCHPRASGHPGYTDRARSGSLLPRG